MSMARCATKVNEKLHTVDPRDNTPTQSTLRRNFWAKNCTTIVPHASYSPDLTPRDFLLFPKLEMALKGRRFDDTIMI
jgi:hypothetical protein